MEGITFLDQVCLTALLCRIQSRKTLLSKIYYILNKNKENTKVSKFLFFLSLSQDYRVLASRERERKRKKKMMEKWVLVVVLFTVCIVGFELSFIYGATDASDSKFLLLHF